MAELLIKLPNGTSVVIPKADPGNFKGLANEIPGNAGTDPVVVQNMAMARGLLVAADYGQRINNMTAAINDDITTLKSRQAATVELGKATSANWTTSLLGGASPGLDPVELTNSMYLTSNGIDITASATAVSLTYRFSTSPTSNVIANYPAIDALSTASNLATTYDGKYVYFTDTKSYAYFLNGDQQTIVSATPYATSPTDAQIDGWKKQLSSQIDSLSSVSQSKQAFLQNLIAELTKFFNFVTNLSERKERDLQGIADRI